MMEIQVFYVRLGCSSLEKAPQSLTLRFVNANNGSFNHNNPSSNGGFSPILEINRSRIFPSQMGVSLTLRRDRMDTGSVEAIYVCTDMVRISDPFSFFICDGPEEIIVCANIKKSCSYDSASLAKMSNNNWSLECNCVPTSIHSRTKFCNGNGVLGMRGYCDSISCMEISVAGRDSNLNSPVILSRTIQHIVMKRAAATTTATRHCRRNSCSTLDVIFENDEYDDADDLDADGYGAFAYDATKEGFIVDSSVSNQVEEHMFYRTLDLTKPPDFYKQCAYFDGDDDGELTWFNTGVRVGVGIGLGMCVGIGVGVSLLMRGYQSTTKTLKKRLL